MIDCCNKPVQKAIKDAKLTVANIIKVMEVSGNSRIPPVLQLVKTVIGLELNRTINTDEVVAIGAAILGSILSSEVKDILLLEVMSLSLGVETMGSVVNVIIPRNTTIPTNKIEIYFTAIDGQTTVEIQVLREELKMVSDNKSLGTFHLDGIPATPRIVP